MNVNGNTDGLVRTLLKLDEADRSNLVEHLPPEKVKNAFLLLLRETAGLPVLQEQALTCPPLAMHPVSGHESIAPSNKRSDSTAISKDLKRARIDAIVIESGEDGAAQITMKNDEIIEIASDAEKTEVQGCAPSGTKYVRRPVDLTIYLRVPNARGSDSWKVMDGLPLLVRAELERRFKETWSLTRNKAQKYAEYTRNPAKYISSERCIHNLLIRGAPSRHQSLREGNKLGRIADDRCIEARRPCAYFALYRNEYIIHLVPLPADLRKGKDWTQIGYWINQLGAERLQGGIE